MNTVHIHMLMHIFNSRWSIHYKFTNTLGAAKNTQIILGWEQVNLIDMKFQTPTPPLFFNKDSSMSDTNIIFVWKWLLRLQYRSRFLYPWHRWQLNSRCAWNTEQSTICRILLPVLLKHTLEFSSLGFRAFNLKSTEGHLWLQCKCLHKVPIACLWNFLKLSLSRTGAFI